MAERKPIFELKNISKRFGGIQALKNVDFDLYPGEVHAVVGENGAGKSTLMRILAGIHTEYEGQMYWKGQPIHLKSPKDALDHGIAMIHQELSVMPVLTVAENIFLGRQPTTSYGAIDWPRMFREADEALRSLGFSLDVRKNLEEYPLGVHQLVEIARTLTSGAEVLIMDEPTSALSPKETDRLLELVKSVAQSGRSVIYISHFLEEVMQVADRITVLRNGEKVADMDAKGATKQKLISLILGKELDFFEESYAGSVVVREDQPHETVLSVNGLTLHRKFEDVSFRLRRGEILGIYGLVGSGHFELAKAIFGLWNYDSGEVILDGKRLPKGSPRAAIDSGIAYVVESRKQGLFMDAPIYQNISLPHLGKLSGLVLSPAREIAAAREVITEVDVRPNDPFKAVGNLSGGNQQKVAIARWLVFPPKVFIVSEPTRGMDVGAKEEVLEILRKLSEQGVGVLVVSSEPETILSVSEHILVMSKGKLVADFEGVEVTKSMLLDKA